jgi:Ras-related protein Rab-5C
VYDGLRIVIALAGNKLDLVQSPPPASTDSPVVEAAEEDDDEADDATATPADSSASRVEGEEEEIGSKAEPAHESRRQVSTEEAQAYATENDLLFFETSAKTGEGVVEVFTEIGQLNHLRCLFPLSDSH